MKSSKPVNIARAEASRMMAGVAVAVGVVVGVTSSSSEAADVVESQAQNVIMISLPDVDVPQNDEPGPWNKRRRSPRGGG